MSLLKIRHAGERIIDAQPHIIANHRQDVALAKPSFNPLEKRDATGKWTKDETRAWLGRHPVDSKNIVDMWDQGTPGEHESGEVWYPNAHKVAVALAARNKVSVREAAGLLANYSPQTAWGQNVVTAAESLREHRAIGGPKARVYYHNDPKTPNDFEESHGIMATAVAERRSRAIEAGQDFEDVMAGGRLKNGQLKPSSLKIRAFGELIANGTNDPAHPRVVIDRHAAGVARGVRFTEEDYGVDGPSSSSKKFDTYAQAYEQAAELISKQEGRTVPPEAVQAATWLTRQRLNGAMASQVGRTRKKLGNQDTVKLQNYAAQYLPEASGYLPKTGYANLSNVEHEPRDARGRWFHGTAAVLKAGDVLVPNHGRGNFDYAEHGKVRTHVFVTNDVASAVSYAGLNRDEHNSTPATQTRHVYEVAPVGLERDPDDDTAHRATSARVLREVFPKANRNQRRRLAGLSTLADQPDAAYDLANPAAVPTSPPKAKLRVRAAQSPETTVRSIAKVFLASRRGRSLSAREEALVLRRLLKPHGVELPAILAALAMTQTEAGDYRGTANAPNARLDAFGLTKAEGAVARVRDNEVQFRASYVANAAQRMQDAIDAGSTTDEASVAERRYYDQHERARRARLDAAAQVQSTAVMFGSDDGTGVLVGWYLNPFLNNDAECVAADGHNFYAEEGTAIGFPGSVHLNCGCYAGQPHYGATLVNEALGNVSRIHGTTAKFKIRRAA